MPTLIENTSLEDCCVLCSRLELQFVELNLNFPQYQLEFLQADVLQSLMQKYGVYFTLHLDENMNVADFNPLVADAYKKTAYQALELAKKIRMPILNMHFSNGIYITLPEKRCFLFDEYYDNFAASLADFRDRCVEIIGDDRIKICVENTDGWDKEFQKNGIEVLLASEKFGLTLDVGHNAGTNADDEGYIKNTRRLSHMHLHDAIGKEHHLELGNGQLDIEGYVKLARENGCRCVLETKTIKALTGSVEYLKAHNLK